MTYQDSLSRRGNISSHAAPTPQGIKDKTDKQHMSSARTFVDLYVVALPRYSVGSSPVVPAEAWLGVAPRFRVPPEDEVVRSLFRQEGGTARPRRQDAVLVVTREHLQFNGHVDGVGVSLLLWRSSAHCRNNRTINTTLNLLLDIL